VDPLAHTLVGANIGATPLGRKTRLSAAAAVIGANAPDIDIFAYWFGSDFGTGFRRGWTHGVLALVVLPFVVTAVLVAFDTIRLRLLSQEQDLPAIEPRGLLVVSAISILTHPTLDWLNNYGMRWLMPFDGTWFYGDSVFIVDPWLWAILGSAWLAGKKRSIAIFATWLLFSTAAALVVSNRSTSYVPVVVAVGALSLVALLWEPHSESTRSRLPIFGLGMAAVLIGGMLTLHALSVSRVRTLLESDGFSHVDRLMVGPAPLNPLRWEIVAQLPGEYRWGAFDWRDNTLTLNPKSLPVPSAGPEWDRVSHHPLIVGYMSWVRFPWYEIERTPEGIRVHVMDARYTRRRTDGFGGTSVLIENEPTP